VTSEAESKRRISWRRGWTLSSTSKLALSWRSQIPEARLPAGSAYHPPSCLSRLVSSLRLFCILRLLSCTWRPHCCTWRAPFCRPQRHSCPQRISCPCAASVPGVMFRRTFKNNHKRAQIFLLFLFDCLSPLPHCEERNMQYQN
jgi:hypothetical protein